MCAARWQLHLAPRGCLQPAEAAFYAAELALVLQFLHDVGVVHCDCKPENVLLADDGHVRLCDFGCAHELDAATGAPEHRARMHVAGTLMCAARERA